MSPSDAQDAESVVAGGTPESLDRHYAWLYPNKSRPCRCEHAYRSLGRDGRINMGKGWVRVTTHPECYHHGLAAQKVFKETKRWPAP